MNMTVIPLLAAALADDIGGGIELWSWGSMLAGLALALLDVLVASSVVRLKKLCWKIE